MTSPTRRSRSDTPTCRSASARPAVPTRRYVHPRVAVPFRRHARAREAVFVVLIAVVLFTVIAFKLAVALTPVEAQARSTLEGRAYETFPTLAAASLADGTFQDSFEQYIADLVPLRDDVLLANAAVQRASICLANLVCGFSCVPTFYGSDIVWCPEWDCLTQTNTIVTDDTVQSYREMAEGYDEVVDSHPDIDFTWCQFDTSRNSSVRVDAELEANVCDYDFTAENFIDYLPDDIECVSVTHDDTAELVDDFFASDHHWNINGAINAYEACAEALGIEPIEFGDVYEAYEGPHRCSRAREGLFAGCTDDAVLDVDYDRSELSVTVDGKKRDVSFLDAGWDDDYDGEAIYADSSKWSEAYAKYYHHNHGILEIDNEELSDGSTLLICGTSFASCMERFFAESYEHVIRLDMRCTDMTTEEAIEAYDPDDVLFFYNLPQSVNSVADED